MFRTEPATSKVKPAITSGSGITVAGWWLFAAQDDSTLVAAKGTDGSLETIRVFPSVEGSDRFSESLGNKKLKPDLEAALTVPVPHRLVSLFGVKPRPNRSAREAVLLVGSGSKAVLRDRIVLIFPASILAESDVVAVQARRFYEALRLEPSLTGTGGDLNIEGVALVRGGTCLRFYNRGNGRPGSVVGSIDVKLDAVLAYLARAAVDPDTPFDVPVVGRRTYDLGTADDGATIGITDAIALPRLNGAPKRLAGELHIVSAIAEHAKSAVNDGHTSDSTIGIELPDGRLLIAPALGIEGAEGLKIEGLSVVSARWLGRPAQLHVNLVAVTDSDAIDPDTPSTLARVELTFRPWEMVGGRPGRKSTAPRK